MTMDATTATNADLDLIQRIIPHRYPFLLIDKVKDIMQNVSSQARLWPDHPQRDYADIAPLSLRGDGAETIVRLQALVHSEPGASIVESRPDYLRAQFTTRLMKFVDDVEFWFDPAAGVIQVRSASRVGRKDFGVNRQRVERLRARLAKAP